MNKILRATVQTFIKPLKLILVVRSDLKLSKGKIAAQCSHASILCYEKSTSKQSDTLKRWLLLGQAKIVLKVDGLDELLALHKNAVEQNIVAELVKDAGHTQVTAGTITVLGLGPDYEDRLDLLVKHLKLL